MVAETLHPLVNELPTNEKRRLVAILNELILEEEQPEPKVINLKLRNHLIGIIGKARAKNKLVTIKT